MQACVWTLLAPVGELQVWQCQEYQAPCQPVRPCRQILGQFSQEPRHWLGQPNPPFLVAQSRPFDLLVRF